MASGFQTCPAQHQGGAVHWFGGGHEAGVMKRWSGEMLQAAKQDKQMKQKKKKMSHIFQLSEAATTTTSVPAPPSAPTPPQAHLKAHLAASSNQP